MAGASPPNLAAANPFLQNNCCGCAAAVVLHCATKPCMSSAFSLSLQHSLSGTTLLAVPAVDRVAPMLLRAVLVSQPKMLALGVTLRARLS